MSRLWQPDAQWQHLAMLAVLIAAATATAYPLEVDLTFAPAAEIVRAPLEARLRSLFRIGPAPDLRIEVSGAAAEVERDKAFPAATLTVPIAVRSAGGGANARLPLPRLFPGPSP